MLETVASGIDNMGGMRALICIVPFFILFYHNSSVSYSFSFRCILLHDGRRKRWEASCKDLRVKKSYRGRISSALITLTWWLMLLMDAFFFFFSNYELEMKIKTIKTEILWGLRCLILSSDLITTELHLWVVAVRNLKAFFIFFNHP